MKILIVGTNSVTSKVTANLTDIFTVENCSIVYLVEGSYKSWVPGRTLNAISTIVPNKGYIIVLKDVVDGTGKFMETSDIGGAAAQYDMITRSTAKNISVKFVDTDGTTVLATKTLTHSAAGVSGDVTPYLGKKIKITRTDYNITYFILIKSTSGGVSMYASDLVPSSNEIVVAIPSDAEQLSVIVQEKASPITGHVSIKNATTGRASVFMDNAPAADMPITIKVDQNDPIGGTTHVASIDTFMPAGQSVLVEEFSISALPNHFYIELADLIYSNDDYFTVV